jgi:hypothetical protein
MQLENEAAEDARWGTGWARSLLEIDGNDLATGRRLLLGLALSWAFGLSVAAVTGAWTASLGRIERANTETGEPHRAVASQPMVGGFAAELTEITAGCVRPGPGACRMQPPRLPWMAASAP